MKMLLLDRTGTFLPNLQHRYSFWATKNIHFFLIPQWFWCTSDRAFLYKAFGSTILSFFKTMFCTQHTCEIFEKGCKLVEFFGQLLSLRAFITKFNASSISVSCLIFFNIYGLSSLTLRDFSISLRIESLKEASAGFSVPFLYFISKSDSCKRKTHLSIFAEGLNV